MRTPPPEHQARIDAQLRLVEQVRALPLLAPVPYFGHLRLDTGLREVDVLLGSTNRTGHAFSVIDWHTAPLAEVFFAFDEGDDYEVEIDERVVSGKVIEKTLVRFHEGSLEAVTLGNGHTYERRGEERWERTHEKPPPLKVRPPSARRAFRSPLEVTLDPAQRQVVDLPPNRSVLLLGEAGFGKTTVALHRLVALQERANRRFRGAVIVPTEGLRRLTEVMLERRGVERVDVWTYEKWAATVARRVFRDLPRRESVNATTQVAKLKRHPALREVLAAFARSRPRKMVDEDHPSHSNAKASWVDLEHLFGDRGELAKVVLASGGAIPQAAIAQVAEHTRIQFLDPTELEYAHVDRDALVTSDGKRIDEGTPLEDAHSVDPEDYAVIFELERLRAEADRVPPAELAAYDCIVVDEAQEFAPLELSLMRRLVRPGGTVIVAGDAAQQVDPTSFFGGWEQVLEDLGAEDAVRTTLEVNYRCPPEVTQLARTVVDRGASVAHEERAITRALHPTPFHLAVWLSDELRGLQTEDPQASITLVTRSPEAAKGWVRLLRFGSNPRLALAGDFEFRPGLTVTAVTEVKGLEFDYVILPDAASTTYPDTPESRRALYVALTRATHQLVLAAAGTFSPMLELRRPRAEQGSLPFA